jgi:hypothetical protein
MAVQVKVTAASGGEFTELGGLNRKGRPIMRTNIYHMAMNAVRHCPELKAYYAERKEDIESGRLDLKPQQLLFAVAIKEVRILFAMCRDRRPYISNYRELKKAA